MNDLRLGLESHDLVINERGDLELLNEDSRVAQQTLKINLLFFKEEWFLNVDYGIPYLQTIFSKGANKLLIDSIIQNATLNSYNISSIETFESIIQNEEYHVTRLVAYTNEGSIVSITNQRIF